MSKSLGLLEVVGLSTAISASDVMVKTANVSLSDIEITKGNGYMTIKIKGDVAAVNASVSAGKTFAMKLNKFVSAKVIARPVPAVMEHLAADAHREVEESTLVVKEEASVEEGHDNQEKQEGQQSSEESEEEDHEEVPAEEVQEEGDSKTAATKEKKAGRVAKSSKKTKSIKNGSKK